MATSTGTRPEVVLRSPWLAWSWCAALLTAAASVLVAVAGATRGESVVVVLGIAGALGAAWSLVRVPFLRVGLGPDGVTNHGLWRTWTAAWPDIEQVEVEAVRDKVVATSWAPVLHLRGGRRRALVQLAGYTTAEGAPTSRMAGQAQRVRDLLTR